MRWNEEPAGEEQWSDSTDLLALFHPQPVPFIIKLAASTKLRVQVIPTSASPAVVTFNVGGFGQARIDELKAGCQSFWDVGSTSGIFYAP